MDTDDWVFEAIGFYQTSGVDVIGIIEYIDYRDHFRYETIDIESALERLAKDGRVLGRDGKYFLAEV